LAAGATALQARVCFGIFIS